MVIGMLAAGFVALVISLGFMIQGPPYTASDDNSIAQMLAAIEPYKPKRILDMGSGTGKLMIRLAEAGYIVDGVELNPLLVLWSRFAIKRRGLQDKARVAWASFWRYDVSRYDMVVVYAIQHVMPRLEAKLRVELRPGTIVVSNYFTFPNLKPVKQTKRVKLYRM